MTLVKFIIPMRIPAKHRARQGKYGNWYTPHQASQENLKSYIEEYVKKNRLKPILKPNLIEITQIFFVRGKATGDLDNYIKSLLDCGKGLLWEDDRQIKRSKEEIIEYSPVNRIWLEVKLYERRNKYGSKENKNNQI